MKWVQVVRSLENLGQVGHGGAGCSVVLEGAGGRDQHVGVFRGDDQSVIVVWAAVCPARDLDGRTVLRYNSVRADQALALDGETYVLRHALDTQWLSAGELLGVVEALAAEAGQLYRTHVLSRIVDEASDRCDRLFACRDEAA